MKIVKSFRLRVGKFLFACLALAGLAACQTDSALDVSAVAPSQGVEVHGGGATVVALLAARSAPGARGATAQARVDGALLALDVLGGSALTLRIYDTGTTASGAATASAAARNDGAVLMAGTGSIEQAAAAGTMETPLIAFVNGAIGAGDTYSFLSDTVDSLLEGVRLTASAAQSQFVLIHAGGARAADLVRLQNGIAVRGGTLVGSISVPDRAAAIERKLIEEKAVIDAATVALIFGDPTGASAVLDVLASGAVGENLTAVIGQPDWPESLLGRPSSQGVLIARAPEPQLDMIGERFRARFGRAPTEAAAQGFDVVAVAAGLARSGATINRQSLTAEQGFKALTGLFRFRPDRSVERRHVLYRVRGGQLEVVQEAGAGF
ncbi:MAG: hypothetical protein AAF940_11385 [Pseudomonadota bacterium]